MSRYGILGFLDDLCNWYGKELFKKDKNDPERRWAFSGINKFEGFETPLEALNAFLMYDRIIGSLNDLREDGQVILDIQIIGDIKDGEEIWSVDIHQDEIDHKCDIEHPWTVTSQKKVDLDKEESRLSERVIVTDKPFSGQAVIDALEGWLRDRDYTFSVRLVNTDPAGRRSRPGA